MHTFTDMRGEIEAHEAAGGYFFSQGALDFFTSDVLHDTYEPETGLFITSEIIGRESGEPRTFAVRRIDLERPARVETIGGRYSTLPAARHKLLLSHRDMLSGR
jgi:hypothetical protein